MINKYVDLNTLKYYTLMLKQYWGGFDILTEEEKKWLNDYPKNDETSLNENN